MFCLNEAAALHSILPEFLSSLFNSAPFDSGDSVEAAIEY